MKLRGAAWLKETLDLPSVQAAYRVMREHKVPGVIRIGRLVRVSEDAIRELIEATAEAERSASADAEDRTETTP